MSIKRASPASALKLSVEFDGATNSVSGTLSDGANSASIEGRRQIWSGTTARVYAGQYNSSVDLPVASLTDAAQPLGVGWQQMTVAPAGTVTGSGRTAEGISYTFGSGLWPNGEVPQFVLIDSNKGSITALPAISLGASVADNRVVGWVDEIKNGPITATDRTYASGIPYLRRNVDGAPWIKPTAALPIVMGLADAAGNASITFTKGGIETAAQFASLAQTFRITKTNTATMSSAAAGNPSNVLMTIAPTTGLFSGSFTLTDTVAGKPAPRIVNYFGIMLSHRNRGYGYFTLPGLTPSTATSPILGGRVVAN